MRVSTTCDVFALSVFALASLGSVGAIVLSPRIDEPVAVIFPPWIAAGAAMARATEAGALALSDGEYSFIAIVRPSSPNFVSRIRREGGIVIKATGSYGCSNRRVAGA